MRPLFKAALGIAAAALVAGHLASGTASADVLGLGEIRKMPERGRAFFGDFAERSMRAELASSGYRLAGERDGLDLFFRYDYQGRPNGAIVGAAAWSAGSKGSKAAELDGAAADALIAESAARFDEMAGKVASGNWREVAGEAELGDGYIELGARNGRVVKIALAQSGEVIARALPSFSADELAQILRVHADHARAVAARNKYYTESFLAEASEEMLRTTRVRRSGADASTPAKTTILTYDAASSSLTKETTLRSGTTAIDVFDAKEGRSRVARFERVIAAAAEVSMARDLASSYARQGRDASTSRADAAKDARSSVELHGGAKIVLDYRDMAESPLWKHFGRAFVRTVETASVGAAVVDTAMILASRGEKSGLARLSSRAAFFALFRRFDATAILNKIASRAAKETRRDDQPKMGVAARLISSLSGAGVRMIDRAGRELRSNVIPTLRASLVGSRSGGPSLFAAIRR